VKVKFRQSGGIAGQIEGVDLATSNMPDDDSAQLRELIEGCDIKEHFEKFSPTARDQLEFLIEIDDETGNRRLMFDELNIPKSCESLVEFLRKRSAWVPLD
jgi:hypothetical protein